MTPNPVPVRVLEEIVIRSAASTLLAIIREGPVSRIANVSIAIDWMDCCLRDYVAAGGDLRDKRLGSDLLEAWHEMDEKAKQGQARMDFDTEEQDYD